MMLAVAVCRRFSAREHTVLAIATYTYARDLISQKFCCMSPSATFSLGTPAWLFIFIIQYLSDIFVEIYFQFPQSPNVPEFLTPTTTKNRQQPLFLLFLFCLLYVMFFYATFSFYFRRNISKKNLSFLTYFPGSKYVCVLIHLFSTVYSHLYIVLYVSYYSLIDLS